AAWRHPTRQLPVGDDQSEPDLPHSPILDRSEERSNCVAELRVACLCRLRLGDQQQVPSRTDGVEPLANQLAQPTPHPTALTAAPEGPPSAEPDSRLRPAPPLP